jgi:pyridoxal phosphate-dependent aminotransferase EpsN
MHLQPVFKSAATRGGAVAARLFQQGLCLPSGSSLSDIEQAYVVETMEEARALRDSRRPMLAS